MKRKLIKVPSERVAFSRAVFPQLSQLLADIYPEVDIILRYKISPTQISTKI